MRENNLEKTYQAATGDKNDFQGVSREEVEWTMAKTKRFHGKKSSIRFSKSWKMFFSIFTNVLDPRCY